MYNSFHMFYISLQGFANIGFVVNGDTLVGDSKGY